MSPHHQQNALLLPGLLSTQIISVCLTLLLWPSSGNSYIGLAAFEFQVQPLNPQCFAKFWVFFCLFNNLLFLDRLRIILGLEISLLANKENKQKRRKYDYKFIPPHITSDSLSDANLHNSKPHLCSCLMPANISSHHEIVPCLRKYTCLRNIKSSWRRRGKAGHIAF